MQSASRRDLKSQQMFGRPFSNEAEACYVIEMFDSYVRFNAYTIVCL